MGVIFIRDIPAAIEMGWWKECKTDALPDVKTLLIAPINGYINGQKHMLGLLYVTSPHDVFRLIHAEPLKALSDLWIGISDDYWSPCLGIRSSFGRSLTHAR